jgi:hypothetical protein
MNLYPPQCPEVLLSDRYAGGKSIVELASQKGVNAKAEAGFPVHKIHCPETRTAVVLIHRSGFKNRKGAI